MSTSIERIRAKIADLETKLADLRIAEREILALGSGSPRARKIKQAPPPRAKRGRKPKSEALEEGSASGRQTISAAIAEVLTQSGSALPVGEIADQIRAAGREIDRRSISYSLQAMKKRGLAKSKDGKWMASKGRAKSASA